MDVKEAVEFVAALLLALLLMAAAGSRMLWR